MPQVVIFLYTTCSFSRGTPFLLLHLWHAHIIHEIPSYSSLSLEILTTCCTGQLASDRKLGLPSSGFENKVKQQAIKSTSCGLLWIHAWDPSSLALLFLQHHNPSCSCLTTPWHPTGQVSAPAEPGPEWCTCSWWLPSRMQKPSYKLPHANLEFLLFHLFIFIKLMGN